MSDQSYSVWTCTIVVPAHIEIPDGFNLPPRRAAMSAIADAGLPIVACFSGWGGTLTDTQKEIADEYYRVDQVPAPSPHP